MLTRWGLRGLECGGHSGAAAWHFSRSGAPASGCKQRDTWQDSVKILKAPSLARGDLLSHGPIGGLRMPVKEECKTFCGAYLCSRRKPNQWEPREYTRTFTKTIQGINYEC